MSSTTVTPEDDAPRAVSPTLVEPASNEDAVVSDTRSEDEKLDMPLPTDPQTIFLSGLFFFAVMAVLYFARDVILPMVLALTLKLMLQPLVRTLEGFRVPKALGALAAMLLLVGVFVSLGMLLTGPASTWAANLPETVAQIQQEFAWIKQPLERMQALMERMGMGVPKPGNSADLLQLDPAAMVGTVASGASGLASHLLETLLILFYLLVFGETFMRRMVEVLPRFRDKRQAVEISMAIERDISAYLVTITLINAVVGVATGVTMWLFGVPGAVLWGVVAFALNFVPILGPVVGVLVFAVVGQLTLGLSWFALLPSAAYLAIHVLEGEIITPLLLARRFTLNPVAVMVGLIFWYWMWGVQGAILAVPLLAISKIMFDRIRPLRAVGHLLEG